MWRQGDIFIERVRTIPPTAPPSASARPSLVLAEGEITGHAHRVRETGLATLYVEGTGVMYLDVTGARVTVIHEEHGEIELERGRYRVWRQREYTPEEIRVVRD